MWNDLYGRSFEAELVSSSPGQVRLRNREGKEIVFMTAQLLTPDQLFVKNWEKEKLKAEKLSEFAAEFEGDLVIRDDKKVSNHKPDGLGQVKFFAFYKSASWCGPCKAFTPKLVAFYNRVKPDHPEFELIFVSSDSSKDSMKDYMTDYKMPWPAFKFGKHKDLVMSRGNGIPCLMVTDASGKKLLDSYNEKGSYIGPGAVMRELEKLLKE